MKKNRNVFALRGFFVIILLSAFVFAGNAQFENHPYHFQDIRKIRTTPVKNQQRTGTCWCFATTSFVETEILRQGGPVLNLSEMFTVRHAYERKGNLYVRFHGLANFGPGGQAHDVINVIRQYGFVPEEVYPGKNYGDTIHNHSELNKVLNAYLDAVVKSRKLTTAWPKGYASVLDAYLGRDPETFTWEGKEFTPESFRNHFHFNPDDYVELTSYTHHPFYTRFGLEVPDNWTHDLYYNLPVNELMDVINYALDHGFSVAWDGDVSEKGFSHKNGVAILPEKPWESMSGAEVDSAFKHPVKELLVTQAMRQKTFDDYQTTDDHLMHLVGTGKDENGTLYYLTKNSWGTKSNKYGGYLFMSEPFVELKTLAIMVHKNALPKDIRKKLGIR
ncbi:MAG: aminopeptidase [Bacteroidales bacterium]|nr:aminopeptidase [Bacteroidales bacterium]